MQEPTLVNQCFQPRLEGEPDLVAMAREALVNAGIGEAIAIFDNDPNVVFAADKNLNLQRYKLNTWLNTQYMATRRNVSEQRMMILDGAMSAAWMETFIGYHIPQMKALGLPVAY